MDPCAYRLAKGISSRTPRSWTVSARSSVRIGQGTGNRPHLGGAAPSCPLRFVFDASASRRPAGPRFPQAREEDGVRPSEPFADPAPLPISGLCFESTEADRELLSAILSCRFTPRESPCRSDRDCKVGLARIDSTTWPEYSRAMSQKRIHHVDRCDLHELYELREATQGCSRHGGQKGRMSPPAVPRL